MNVVVFIGSSRQLTGWARCDGQRWPKEIDWRESCIDGVALNRKMTIE